MNAGVDGRFSVKSSVWVAIAATALGCVLPLAEAQSAKSKKAQPAATAQAAKGYDYEHPEAQPATENLDLEMYGRIRVEGLDHSHIMEYASGLFDGIGPRLTGSPNMAKANAWTRDQLTAMGCANAKLESWGEFGMGWRQISTSVDMATPDTAVLIAQATPWSPATPGAVTAERDRSSLPAGRKRSRAMERQARRENYFVRQAAGGARPIPRRSCSITMKRSCGRFSDYPLDGDFKDQSRGIADDPNFWAAVFKQVNFKEKISKFFADEHAVAIFLSSYAGDGGIMRDDNNEAMGQRVFMADHKQPIPSAVLANEGFGRIARLLQAGVPVTATVNINTTVHRRARAGLQHDRGNSGNRPEFEGSSGDGRRASGQLDRRHRRDG